MLHGSAERILPISKKNVQTALDDVGDSWLMCVIGREMEFRTTRNTTMNTTLDPFDFDLAGELNITHVDRRAVGGGCWVRGKIAGHRFDALVFREHAEFPDYELGRSRISKLWLQRLADKKTMFHWDRGLDIDATTDLSREIVDFLATGLADLIFAN